MVSPVDALAFGELVSEGQATLVKIGDAVDGYYGWAAGSATGGPNGDGYYPLPAPGAPVMSWSRAPPRSPPSRPRAVRRRRS